MEGEGIWFQLPNPHGHSCPGGSWHSLEGKRCVWGLVSVLLSCCSWSKFSSYFWHPLGKCGENLRGWGKTKVYLFTGFWGNTCTHSFFQYPAFSPIVHWMTMLLFFASGSSEELIFSQHRVNGFVTSLWCIWRAHSSVPLTAKFYRWSNQDMEAYLS